MPSKWIEAKQKVADEGMCRVCGVGKMLDPAHIIPRSQGGGLSADDIVPLCRNCHTAYDGYELDLLPHLEVSEQINAVRLVGIARAYKIITGEKNVEKYNS
jgi:5-methylcytosine-specific restriction endonuclease McrA